MPVDMDLVKRTSEEMSRRASFDTPYFKFEKDGTYVFRILPPYGSSGQFWIEFASAFVGPNNKPVVPAGGADCPLQKRIDALNKEGSEASKKQAKTIKPKTRISLAIIDRAAEGKGPQLWTTNITVFRDIMMLVADPEYGDITDPNNGLDLSVVYQKETKTGFPEWKVYAKRHSTPLSTDPRLQATWLSEDWFSKWHVGKITDNELIQACLDGTEAALFEHRKKMHAEGQQTGQQPASQETQQPAASPPTTPANIPPQAAPALSPIVNHPFQVGTKMWTVVNGAAVETTVEAVCEKLKAGTPPSSITLMALDQQGGWLNAATMGFVVTIPTPPPVQAPPVAPPVASPPATPPAAPPPAPVATPPLAPPVTAPGHGEVPFNAPQSEEAALAQQLAAFPPQQPPRSEVGNDIRDALAGK